ncbi:AAA family ATPase [Microbacterium flavum]|uniref:MoxR family ATPase n=1 Tax=Microbacterium flavum TaxID=415216 RepID=A0ABS5XRJ6_9MICO|nr:MoxR family ATPase [Microbacterium flavum]MBT8797149.1 MoxR family ATPase [Microbacterium flavum]
MSLTEAGAACRSVLDEVERAIVGKREALELVLTAIVAGGHVLIEDFPGLGKTLAARSFAHALGLDFRRAQFTPDQLPADLTGSYIYDQSRGEFSFRAGPVFAGFLLADEINRTPPKTQAALLEAMQEHQVTVEGRTHALPRPFHVMATANPVETEGTYPLPEAQLDRFLLRLRFGYPDAAQEWEIVERRIARRADDIEVGRVLDARAVLAVQQAAEDVYVHPAVGRYAVEVTAATRSDSAVLVGASPRGSLALVTCARARALIDGRGFVSPDDIKALASAALAHRITIRPELWLSGRSGEQVVGAALERVPVPVEYRPDRA